MAAPRVAMPVAQPVAQPPARSTPKPAPPAAGPPAPQAHPTLAAAPGGAHTSASSAVAHPVSAPVAASPASASSSSDQLDARLILDMPGTRAYTLVDGAKKLVEDGKLEVLSSHVDGAEVYLILLGSVRLALRQEVPCLEMSPRSFVFPADGATYGLVVADAINAEVLEVFRLLLVEHTSFRTAAVPQSILSLPDRPDKVVSTAHQVAAGLGAGSVVVATGVIKGGKMVGEFLQKGGAYLTSRLKPNEKATVVSPETKARLQKAKLVSGAACKVSKALVVGAMATTEMLSKQLSAAIKETDVGKKLSSDPDKPNERLDAAKTVGKATIGAVLQVYQAVEQAVWGIANDAAAATVTVVSHKYGSEAGATTQEGLTVVGNVAQAAHAVKQVGVKSIAKKTALKAGQDVLTTPAERKAAEEAVRAQVAQSGASGSGSVASVMGQALGLPPGIDPLQAIEAVQAAAVLQQAVQQQLPASAAHPGERVVVATAVATGRSQEEATENATKAAQNAAASK